MKSLVLVALSVTAFAQVADFDDDAFAEGEPFEVEQVGSVEAFEPSLAPYGEWVWLNNVRVFRPSVSVVGADFIPYTTHGQWVRTEAGWSFASTLPFGWATFHYGRWWREPAWGWVWVPDTTWGPAWVDWRFGGGYAGWAPLPPLFVRDHRPHWFFVDAPYFSSRELVRYAVPRVHFERAFRVTAPLPTRVWRGRAWSVGPTYREVAHIAVTRPQRHSMREYVPPAAFYRSEPNRRHAASNRGQLFPPPPSPYVPPRNRGPLPPPPSQYVRPPPSRGPVSPPPSQYLPPPPNRGRVAPPPSQYVPPPNRGRPNGSIPPPPNRLR
jgi:hypothetical protein